MLEKPWQGQLRQAFASLQKFNALPRVAVVGIGHELRGDDGAGVALARQLNGRLPDSLYLVIEAGPAAENCYGLLRRFLPDLVLFVDAALMDQTPGTVRWLEWPDVSSTLTSTHTLSLDMLATFLRAELGCEVTLIGIQPAHSLVDAPLSPAVREAVLATAEELMEILSMEEGAALS